MKDVRWLDLAGLLLLVAVTVTADTPAPNTWKLKFSDPAREGRFLNIPIQYGEWVPINRARALVENIASKISQQDTLVAPPDDPPAAAPAVSDLLEDEEDVATPDSPNDRADHGNVVYTQEQQQRPGAGPHTPANKRPPTPQQQQQNRRQDPFLFGFGNLAAPPPPPANRGQRKLPPPSSANSVNNNNNGQFRQQKPGGAPASWPGPQQQQQQQVNSNNQFGFIPAAFNSFNPFAFFQPDVERPQQQQQQQPPQLQQQQQPPQLQQQQQQLPQQQLLQQPQQPLIPAPSYPTKRPIQQQQQLPQQLQQALQTGSNSVGGNIRNINNNVNRNNNNDYSAYIESLNAIQTIPAPDLTKIGPPVIELDSKDGQIVVGQPFSHEDRDHLAGFVSLDFDGFAAGGDLEADKKTKKSPAADTTSKEEKQHQLSLLVGGGNTNFNTADFEADLVTLLNSKDDDPLTYILGADKATPAGFAKLDLPFMDPTEHKGQLPKVFIAPVGKPIPKGYKGKPLPAEPQTSRAGPSTTERVLVVETVTTNNQDRRLSPAVEPSPEGGQSTPSNPQKVANSFRFKLQKERPSLSQFYLKNKKDKFEELKKKPEKPEKFLSSKSRGGEEVNEELASTSSLSAQAPQEENAEQMPQAKEGTDKLAQEVWRTEAATEPEAILPPLTILSPVAATTTPPVGAQEPSASDLTETQPTVQASQLGQAEVTTTSAAATVLLSDVTESAAAGLDPIVQSTQEQQDQQLSAQLQQELTNQEPLAEQQQMAYDQQQQKQLADPEQQEQHQTAEQLEHEQDLPSVSSTVIPEQETSYQPNEPLVHYVETTSSPAVTPDVAALPQRWETTQYVASTEEAALSTTTTTTATMTPPPTALPSRKALRTTQDPVARLEALRKQKQDQLESSLPQSSPLPPYPVDLATSEDEEVESGSHSLIASAEEDLLQEPDGGTEGDDESALAVAVASESSRPKTRLRLRKYNNGSSSSSSGEAASVQDSQPVAGGPVKKFGKRIRSRKRPAFWSSRPAVGEEGGVEPTLRPSGPLGVLRQKLTSAGSEPTAATAFEVLKTEDYKKKFRPFFDQLYSQFNKGDDEVGVEAGVEAVASVTDGPLAPPRRLGVPRKRSTTPQTPITVDAEIYEVHPQTRVRITTRTPRTTQTTLSPFSEQEEVNYTNVDYDQVTVATIFESSTTGAPGIPNTAGAGSASTLEAFSTESEVRDGDNNNGDSLLGEVTQIATSTAVELAKASAAESSSTNGPAAASTEVANAEEVHETADKHSTFAPLEEGAGWPVNSLSEDDNDVLAASSLDLDIQNEIGVDQEFEESQQVQQAWNDLLSTSSSSSSSLADSSENKRVDTDEDEKSAAGADVSTVAASSRLSSYDKKIDTSLFGAEDFSLSSVGDHDDEFAPAVAAEAAAAVNEHGQQLAEANNKATRFEESTATSANLAIDAAQQQQQEGGWQGVSPLKAYVEIDRSNLARPTASVEVVPITESKDYTEPDVFYDVNKDGFEDTTDAKDVYSFPVSVLLNLPEATTTALPTDHPTLLEERTTMTEEAVVGAGTTEEEVFTAESPTTTAFIKDAAASHGDVATTTVEPVRTTTSAFGQPTTPSSSAAPTTDVPRAAQDQITTDKHLPDEEEKVEKEEEEVYLGSHHQPDPTRTSHISEDGFEVIHIGKPATQASPTAASSEEEPLNSAHKIPTSLWTAFENSRELEKEKKEDEDRLATSTTTTNLSGSSASASEEDEDGQSLIQQATIIDIEDLPKPDEHTSEVLLIEEIPSEALEEEEADNETEIGGEQEEEEDGGDHKLPKSFDFGPPDVQAVVDGSSGDVQIHSFGLEQTSPLLRKDESSVGKKREDWVKNWAARKFSSKPKFPRGPLPLLSQVDTTDSPTDLSSEVIIDINSKSPASGFFSPTIPPLYAADPTAFISSTTGEERWSSSSSSSPVVAVPLTNNNANVNNNNVDYKSSLLEKYSRNNKIKNSLFHNKATEIIGINNAGGSSVSSSRGGGSDVGPSAAGVVNRPQPVVGGVPLGANTDIHRSYGGKQLSQADFESQILGVSSATEISVRSMICVKGRCFNADDMSKLIS